MLIAHFNGHILDSNRRISRFRVREGALPPPVLGVHVGKRHLSASTPANAQHRGAAGVSGPHSEDGGHQVGPSHYLGGMCENVNLSKYIILFLYKAVFKYRKR